MNVLKELHFHSSAVQLNGKLAYVPQKPWILSGTVKANILFGLPYDENRFSTILEACALSEVSLFKTMDVPLNSYFITSYHSDVGHCITC